MTSTQRVRRKILWRIGATVVVLGILEAIGYAAVSLIVGLPAGYQAPFLYGFTAAALALSFGFGLLVERIPVRSWDTWIGDLGPAEIDVLIPRLEQQRDREDA